MRRVVILGRGGAGKSTLARRLSEFTGLPTVELDAHFWQRGLTPTPSDRWRAIQADLVRPERWILDGDLGQHDVLEVRLAAADTVVVLDFPFWRCAWRAARRCRENAEFWCWVWRYRREDLPRVSAQLAAYAGHAAIHVLRNPRDVREFLATATGQLG